MAGAPFRICFTSDIFIAQLRGGISRYYCEIAKVLAENFGCKVLTSSPAHRNAHLQSLRSPLISNGLFSPIQFPGSQRALRYIHRMCAPSRLAKSDVIHSTYFNNDHLSYPKNIPVVTTVYDLIHEKLANDRTLLAQKKRECDQADLCIAISHSTCDDMVNLLDVPREKIRVIHLAATVLPTPIPDFRFERPFLLWVGPRNGYKNFTSLLKALDRSSFGNFDVVCTGTVPFSQDELSLSSSLATRNIRLRLVNADDQLLANLYANAICLVYISLYEGFGIPPLEAMMLDCPVVCSNTASLPEVVGESALLCDPSSTESIAASLQQIVESPELRGQLQQLGRSQVAKFSWEKCASQTYDTYRELTGH